eukprot:evm.model.scf_3806.2 EVM.evm.TU.scf_3806.2   scf_3806:6656-10396(-)
MAGAIGLNGIHNVAGRCDLCGLPCDPNADELNALDCTYPSCPSLVYHQDCVERYLRSIRLEKNRKTGFKCPRGTGKGTASAEPCPGKIGKSHPIHPRNQVSKKKKKMKPADATKQKPAAPPTKQSKGKEKDVKQKSNKEKEVSKPTGIRACDMASTPFSVPPKSPTTGALRSSRPQLAGEPLSTAAKAGARSWVSRDMPSQDGPRPVLSAPTIPLASAWSKPLSGVSRKQNPDMGSLKAFPPSGLSLPLSLLGEFPAPGGHRAPSNSADATRLKTGAATARSDDAPSIAPWASPLQPPTWGPASRPAAHSRSQSYSVQESAASARATTRYPPALSMDSEELPVGMDYLQDNHLTKSQRRNMKRTEKKRKGASQEKESTASSLDATPFQAPGCEQDAGVADRDKEGGGSVLRDLCVESMVAWKASKHVRQLHMLGFSTSQSLRGLRRYGSDVETAICWLLEGGEEHGGDRTGLPGPEIDLSEELNLLAEVQAVFGIPAEVAEQAVVDCNGDLNAAVCSVLDPQAEEAFSTCDSDVFYDADVGESPPSSVCDPARSPRDDDPVSPQEAPGESSPRRAADQGGPADVGGGPGSPTKGPTAGGLSALDRWMLGGVPGSSLLPYRTPSPESSALGQQQAESGAADVDLARLSQRRGTEIPLSRGLVGDWGDRDGRRADPGLATGLANLVTDLGHYNRLIQREAPGDPYDRMDRTAHIGSGGDAVGRRGLGAGHLLWGQPPGPERGQGRCGGDGPQAALRAAAAVAGEVEQTDELEHLIGSLLCR